MTLPIKPSKIGSNDDSNGLALLPKPILDVREEKNHLHLKLFDNFKRGTMLSLLTQLIYYN
jgi:hypothetical protein